MLESQRGGKKRGSKSKSQAIDSSTLAIDEDWVTKYARQVSKLLLVMKVVGIYVWIIDTCFKNSTITLCQAVFPISNSTLISLDSLSFETIICIVDSLPDAALFMSVNFLYSLI
ncbi:hypothetical protein P3X46_020074 [Hevea brasiliensis]|uniref:Uncharacterized protein n=1 Tax=Hevea brasiliensis TaxID=3981 RepID=A0ABQ9LKS1_HEVBR|nr:hypothetical protein P3X46_020074 [Hevea brasiliensis]